MKKFFFFILSIVFISSCSTENSENQNETINPTTTEAFYFPPNDSEKWETTDASALNWNVNATQELSNFLEINNTKGFIILYKGKIVIENYFNNHDANSNWYWASAGKTLTTAVSGIAEDQGIININDKVSQYLGTGWTSATLDKEDLITCKHLLSMSSGLDDTLGDSTSPENLQYIADAGSRWAYHNVYVKMQDVIAQASNQDWNSYFNSNLKNRIGMNGAWLPLGDLNVYWSNTRSMARFGLLIAANGKWENTQIVSANFLSEATQTSQNINEAYGYLWWLNGKSSYHLPQSQLEFPGSLVPNAPNDMYCALGKNDQKIYIVPSKDLVVIRMGDAADDENFALSSFDNDLWEKINLVIN
ncbi:serine hydrolase [Lacinutrix sp. MedPE-SW]|uniref:serine hydrolase domain-containing protein n=1 Tax=Lacinutrix sp. MedPE-SW TaxID=1860087 RepID=UPI000914C012|nr:serine hydrolase [Lacinutrix sp. MedPE-SW]OIQ22765.1 MAG: serine hydrolase [Lacinutrix sp. MedPE-SW]